MHDREAKGICGKHPLMTPANVKRWLELMRPEP